MRLSKRVRFQLCSSMIAGLVTYAQAGPASSQPVAIERMNRAMPADLKVVQVIIAPTQPVMKRDLARISVVVKNVGGMTPSRACSLSMSVWSVNNNGERVAGRTSLPNLIPWYTNNIPRLNPGQEVTISKTLTFDFGGRHKVDGAIITEGLSAGEENGQNNLYSKIFSVTALRPDLVVCFKKYNKSPAHATSWYPVRVRNIGQASSPPCDLRFWIEKKGVKHYQIPALAPGQEHSIQRSVYWASQRVSDFSLRVDSKDEVAEMSETNNTIEGTICTNKYCANNNSVTACSDTIH